MAIKQQEGFIIDDADPFQGIDYSGIPRDNSPSQDSHSSGVFSPIRLDDLEHDADTDSSGDTAIDPFKNKTQDRRKTKRRISSNVFSFKKEDTAVNDIKSFENVMNIDLDLGAKSKSADSKYKRTTELKWTKSKSFSSSTDENDKVEPASKIVVKSSENQVLIDSILYSDDVKSPFSSGDKIKSLSKKEDKNDKASNTAVDGLLFEIYDKYQSSNDHLITTESDITELSTTSMTSVYVASSFENDERGKMDKNYLATKDVVELEKMVKELRRAISMLSSKLVKLLKQRDRNAHKIQENFNVLTALLQAKSQKRRVDTRIRFSFIPRPGKQGFRQWVDALKAVSRISHGMPPSWRKRTWLSLAEYFLKDIDWEHFKKLCFNDRRNPDDDELDTQIVKDLHRTGCGWFFEHDSAEDRASLKRVLLAYARWNKQIGYCQGFNVIAALILQVMEGNEEHALKVMIFLVDYVLPRNYFSNNLRALSVDMAVLRDLMQMKLSSLAQHLERMQKEAMDQSANSSASYEPPLINMFTMQWFLTLFATCLPRNTVLRIWDAVLLEGSDVLLRVALAIWAKLGCYFDNVNTAADFYMKMGQLIQELMTDEFIDVQKLLQAIYQMAPFPWPALVELREKYTYDIHPFTTFRANQKSEHKRINELQQVKKPASDEEDIGDIDEETMVGCLGFVSSENMMSPSKNKLQRNTHKQNTEKRNVNPKTDITKVTPGAYTTDQDAQNAYKEQMRAKEMMRETEKLDLGKLRNQYGRMRRLQQKAMLVFNADDFKDESYKIKNPPSAINHLFVDVNNVTAPPRARYRKPSNFPALKAPSKGGSPIFKPASSPQTHRESLTKFVNEDKQTTPEEISTKITITRSDSFSIKNPYVMHEVQGEPDNNNPTTTDPGAHAEIMNKTSNLNITKSAPPRSKPAQISSEMKSTSLLYKVDKSALYPSNFKPFPSRNTARRKMVSGK